jgi:hypothetical protein
MTTEEAEVVKELISAIDSATEGLLAVSRTATETIEKIRSSMGKARDIITEHI